jgi:DNA polymerase, archaea type
VKILFWLLDINPRIYEDKSKVEIWLWGIDSAGNRVLVVDRNFTAYFYVLVIEGADALTTSDTIMTAFSESIAKVEVVVRHFFGKPVTAIKVCCRVPTDTARIAKQLRSIPQVADCLEDDVRVSMRYLIDNNLAPCTWMEIEATEEANVEDIRVTRVFAAKTPPKELIDIKVPSLRVLAFNMICYGHEGSPKPDRNPVLMFSTVASNREEHQFIVNEDRQDRPIIADFLDYIRHFDPDIIVSYGANTMDWSYLRSRTHKLKLHLNFDRSGSEPHTSVYGHVSATGIVNVDIADFMDMFPEVKVKTLGNFASHLGVINDQAPLLEDGLFADYWNDKSKREQLVQFSLSSARGVFDMASLLMDFAMQLSALTSLPLDQVMTAATGFRVEWFLIKQAVRVGELTPKRVEQPYIPYVGGLVLSPKPGLHENIAVLDFKSMYPNIMLTYNLSPDTYVAPNMPDPPSGVYIAPEVGHRFRKEPAGFYSLALAYLIAVRGTIRLKMKNINSKTIEYKVLDARQKVVKILTNAVYGYAGWIGARWYLKPVAEAASAWGRDIILTSTQMAEKEGLEIVYGDTDSLFIKYNMAKALQLQADIKRELKLDVEISEVYNRILFTEAKKRYAGLRQDDSLDIVGLEVIRGDWAEVAKTVQRRVLEIILREQSPKKAVEYVRSVVADLKNGRIPLHDLIIWKTLTKPPEDYAIKAPHVAAAKMLIDKGWRLTVGDKVGYVVLAKKGQLFTRVKPYVFAENDKIDVDYYVTNQILPVASRILSFFDVSETELLEETKETQEIRNLMDYV